MPTTVSQISAALKFLYPQKRVKEVVLKNHPLLGRVKKNEDAGGRATHIALRYATSPGRSADFAAAQAMKAAAQYAGFDVDLKDEYGLFSISGKAIRSARGSEKSLVDDLVSQGEGILTTLKNSYARAIFGNGGGAIGTIESGSASTTLTLTQKADMVNFQKGFTVSSSNTDGTSGADDAENITISAVNPIARTITKTGGNWNANGNFAAGDSLFIRGDFGAKMSGLGAWVPASDPGATSYYGVDRTADVLRLGGYRYTGTIATDATLQRCLLNVATELSLFGGTPDEAYMNPLDWVKLEHELESKTMYQRMPARDSKGDFASIGYTAIKVMGPAGEIMVYSDPFCPKGRMFVLTSDTIELISAGPWVGWLNEDSAGHVLRESAADAYEGRMGGYINLTCDAPGYNANVNIADLVA